MRYLWYSTSSNNTSQPLSWQTRGLWREIMSWEVHDMLFKSLWLDLKTDGSPRKETISEPLHSEYFLSPEQIFMKRESCFCLQSRFWLWCTAGSRFVPQTWSSEITMMSPFSTDLLPLHRGALLALWCLLLPHLSPIWVAVAAKTKSAGDFIATELLKVLQGSMRLGDQVRRH